MEKNNEQLNRVQELFHTRYRIVLCTSICALSLLIRLSAQLPRDGKIGLFYKSNSVELDR